jgi:hypothetical protein
MKKTQLREMKIDEQPYNSIMQFSNGSPHLARLLDVSNLLSEQNEMNPNYFRDIHGLIIPNEEMLPSGRRNNEETC